MSMKFQKKHSRNSYDWDYQLGDDGRHTLIANGGVRKRCGLIVTALGRFPGLTKESAAEYLRANFHVSYTRHDLSAVFRQLVKHDIATNNSGTFTLTKKGADIWHEIEKVWLGDK